MNSELEKNENYISQLVTDSQLLEANINSNLNSIKLEFFTDKDNKNFILEFFNIIQYSMSKFLEKDEDSSSYYIVKAKLEILKDGGSDILKKLGYGYKDFEGNVLYYPNESLFYFQTEGDICISLIAKTYSLNRN
jgi:hypothetical protein